MNVPPAASASPVATQAAPSRSGLRAAPVALPGATTAKPRRSAKRPQQPIGRRQPGPDPRRMLCRSALAFPRGGQPEKAHRRCADRATTAAGNAHDRRGRGACPFRAAEPHAPEPCWQRRQPRSRRTESRRQNPIHRGGSPVRRPAASARKTAAQGPHAPIRPSPGTARQQRPRRKQPMHQKTRCHAPMPGHASPGRRQ
jgi:hypothetical protein